MNGSNQEHFIGIDVGTSTVRCVVGMYDPNGGNMPSIIGHGQSANQGMRRGTVVHVDEVAEAISKAVTEAERISGVPIKQATVNVNGSHVGGINSEGVIAISAANREITHEDRLRVEEAATIVNIPPNREIVQFFAKNYTVDGQKNIKDPIGMTGVRLEVDAHIVTAASTNMRNLDASLEKSDIMVNHHTVSGLAAAEAVMTRQQREAGTALIDIGAGTTNLIVFEDGEVQHVAILPIGGQHITNDLAIGLKTDIDIAEQVKIQHANLSGKSSKKDAIVKIKEKTHTFEYELIEMVVESRVEELLEYVNKELQKIKRAKKLPGGIVITGGTSKIKGIDDLAKEKLQLPSRIGKLQNIGGLIDTVEDQTFVTVVGLMLLDMLLLPALPPVNGRSSDKVKAVLGGMLDRFKH